MFQGFIQSAHASFKLEALKDLYCKVKKRSTDAQQRTLRSRNATARTRGRPSRQRRPRCNTPSTICLQHEIYQAGTKFTRTKLTRTENETYAQAKTKPLSQRKGSLSVTGKRRKTGAGCGAGRGSLGHA